MLQKFIQQYKKDYSYALKINGYNYEISYLEEFKNRKIEKWKIIRVKSPILQTCKNKIGKSFLK